MRPSLCCLIACVVCHLSAAILEQKSTRKKRLKSKQAVSKQIAPKTSFDFGEVKIGSRLEKRIELVNPTDKPLRVKSLSSSCGCMSVSLDSNEIAVGEKGFIKVKFNTERFIGKRTSAIHVLFEQPKDLEIKISAKVDIRNLIVDPETVILRGQAKDRVGSGIVMTVKRHGSPYWKINSIAAIDPAFEATIVERKIERATVTYSIQCKANPSLLADNDESVYSELVFATNDSQEPEFRIPIKFHPHKPVRVSLSTVVFGKSDKQPKTVVVRTDEPTLIHTEFSGSGYSIVRDTAVSQAPKKVHCLQISRDEGADQRATLVIRFGALNSENKTVTVELLGPAEKQ